MSLLKKLLVTTGGVAFITLGVFSEVQAASITNGGFETGDFTGWTVTDQVGGSGSWFNTPGGNSPTSGSPILAPFEGTRYAVTD